MQVKDSDTPKMKAELNVPIVNAEGACQLRGTQVWRALALGSHFAEGRCGQVIGAAAILRPQPRAFWNLLFKEIPKRCFSSKKWQWWN